VEVVGGGGNSADCYRRWCTAGAQHLRNCSGLRETTSKPEPQAFGRTQFGCLTAGTVN